jgi:hypothetical protein
VSGAYPNRYEMKGVRSLQCVRIAEFLPTP